MPARSSEPDESAAGRGCRAVGVTEPTRHRSELCNVRGGGTSIGPCAIPARNRLSMLSDVHQTLKELGTMSATLKLTRHLGGMAYTSQKWPIAIDGNIVESIGQSQTVELSIEPGHHTLRLGSKRHLSPERTFQVADGEVVNFRCRGKYGLGAYIIALIKPDFWIWLNQE